MLVGKNGSSAQLTKDQDEGLEGKTLSPQLPLSQARSASAIENALASLSFQEASITASLDSLKGSQNELQGELRRLDLLRANLGSLAVSTRAISNGMLSNAAVTAKKISTAVNRLDLEQDRVKATLGVVEQVVELKACVLGVAGSMGAPQDWEAAAAYLSRASRIPQDIVNGSFAEENVPTADVPDPPKVTLENAADSLRGLFLREFEKAAQEGNGAKVTRFFKLFPLIGKPEVGLEVYGRYVCQGVASRARANLNASTTGIQRKDGFFYVNALTKLFEHIAQIVEQHGSLVELHYGAGRMIRVIERLQIEGDVQGGIILDTWGDERAIDRKLTDIRSYAFTFLVQSFLPSQPTRTATPRTGSPAARGSSAEAKAQGEEDVDMKTIDGLLSEITVMLARWSLYSRFIATKCRDDLADAGGDATKLQMPPVLESSNLHKKISDRLIMPINAIATFVLRRSVERAFQLHEQPQGLSLNPSKSLPSNPPFISSAVDDIMYVVNQVVERSLSTSQRTVALSVIQSIARVLDSDFVGMVQRKMRDESYPKAAVQGLLPPEHTVIAFIVLINDLDVATSYVKTIVQSRVEQKSSGSKSNPDAQSTPSSDSSSLATLYPFNNDASSVMNALRSMQRNFEAKTTELIGDGIYVLFKNVIKPKLRPVVADAFRDVDYQLDEEEAAVSNAYRTDAEMLLDRAEVGGGGGGSSVTAASEDAVQYHFSRGWDSLTKPIARLFTDPNFDKLLSIMVSYLSEVLEKRIWSYYGRMNELGSVRLERDVASIVNAVVRGGGRYELRDAFVRCTQICLVANMEQDEWDEVQAVERDGGGVDEGVEEEMEWKIDGNERVRARSLVSRRL